MMKTKKTVKVLLGGGLFGVVILFSGCMDSEKNIQNVQNVETQETQETQEDQETQKQQKSQIALSVSAKKFKAYIDAINANDDTKSIIDVRTFSEFQSGHIKNAELIDVTRADFKTKLSALDKNKTYFIYCRSGNRSGKALQIMKNMGFVEVYNLQYGINDWNANAFPLSY